jgi:DNA-binding GntR family transcriptional regulator
MEACAEEHDMDLAESHRAAPAAPVEGEHLSYKFQRLRERLRQAVASGELNGKLPGERELARRFKANPKTLSKALTDLAAEGLLERAVGRGTYVRGAAPAKPSLAGAGGGIAGALGAA